MILQQIINGLMLGSVYVLVAVAFSLTIGVLNFLNFSIPGLFMIGGMAFWVSTAHFGLGLVPSAGLSLLVAALVAVVVERLTFTWTKSSNHEVPLVSSLGFLILFEELSIIAYGSESQNVTALVPDMTIHLQELVIGGAQMVSLILSVGIVAALSLFLMRTQMGRGIRAVAEAPRTAEILGVNLGRVVPLIFVMSGLAAALSGVLFAVNYGQVSPFMGDEVGMKGISAMIVGGMGSVWGGVLGGLLIGMAEVLALYYFGSSFVDIAVYGLLLLILVFRPQGILGAKSLREKL
jgi:branched-chain amino acid transport system permease protein